MDLELTDDSQAHRRLVRPYMVTGGRTDGDRLAVETLVVREADSTRDLDDEGLETVERCEAPISLAELAIALQLPFGITRVLAADLIETGHLRACRTATRKDALIVRRILDAIR